jgi:hypothetical protein
MSCFIPDAYPYIDEGKSRFSESGAAGSLSQAVELVISRAWKIHFENSSATEGS